MLDFSRLLENCFGGCCPDISESIYDPIATQGHVDLFRFIGLWYEVGRIDNDFQPHDSNECTAFYGINDDQTQLTITNEHTVHIPTGVRGKFTTVRQKITGTATPLDDNSDRLAVRLKVWEPPKWCRCIVPSINANGLYCILRLYQTNNKEDNSDPYSVAIIGHPSLKYLWILSRRPYMNNSDFMMAKAACHVKGYDESLIHYTGRVMAPSITTEQYNYLLGLNPSPTSIVAIGDEDPEEGRVELVYEMSDVENNLLSGD